MKELLQKLRLIEEQEIIESNDDLARSYATLVKYNNGLFKSEKQASYLLAMRNDGDSYVSVGNVYGNPYQVRYYCDEKGVFKVTKSTRSNPVEVTEWERKEEGSKTLTVQDAKELKRLKSLLKQRLKKIEDRDRAYKNGEYGEGNDDLYHQSTNDDLEFVDGIKKKISQYE